MTKLQAHLPLPQKELKDWANQMVVALNDLFNRIEGPAAGEIILWPDSATIPISYLPCDGGEYAKSVSISLYKILGESSPGMFATPVVTGPSGSVAVIRV